ncbi:MAG: hypothetical protein PVI91_02210 [Gammaproteobacteria bacterium]|jgi:hypothetical protein
MAKISTMKEFKETLETLSLEQQRVLAARFVADVLDLTDDDRVRQAQKIASDPNATPESLMSAYHSAWHAALESSVHGDMELVDWHKQTAHFVAKACSECLAPAHHGIAWRHLAFNVASHCRMARLCATVEHEQDRPSLSAAEQALNKQIQTQFEILGAFLEDT